MDEVVAVNLRKLVVRRVMLPEDGAGTSKAGTALLATGKAETALVATGNITLYLNETADALGETRPEVDILVGVTVDPAHDHTQFSQRRPTGSDAQIHLGKLTETLKALFPSEVTAAGGHPGAAALRFNCPRTRLPLVEVKEEN